MNVGLGTVRATEWYALRNDTERKWLGNNTSCVTVRKYEKCGMVRAGNDTGTTTARTVPPVPVACTVPNSAAHTAKGDVLRFLENCASTA